ncbi:MAG: MFS transporter, partial [Kordiimonadaceae bacterium]|nr:MFS transporter [Kordiimonadaceae bacterium]
AHYGISVTHATALFSYITVGVFFGCFLSMFAFSALGTKRVILIANTLLLVVMIITRLVDQADFLPVSFSILGVCGGLLLSGAAISLTAVYTEKHRASALLATDSFYSLAGVLSTYAAGAAAARHLHWTTAYAIVAVACLIIALLTMVSRYPSLEVPRKQTSTTGPVRWPLGVFFVAAALTVYVTGLTSIYSWVPTYATTSFGALPAEAGALVGQMFTGMFFGQLAMFFLALRVNVSLLILMCSSGAFLATIAIGVAPDIDTLSYAMLILGLLGGGLLKTLISFGTQFSKKPTARMVGFLMFSMTLGSAIAPALSAWIVEQESVSAALNWASTGYGVTLILLVISLWLKRINLQRRLNPDAV